jgi:hypothetical protein
MGWDEIRAQHPEQWLVIEAFAAHSVAQRRILDRVVVVEECGDGAAALRRYRELTRLDPGRELYFIHTRRPDLAITERSRIGTRGS